MRFTSAATSGLRPHGRNGSQRQGPPARRGGSGRAAGNLLAALARTVLALVVLAAIALSTLHHYAPQRAAPILDPVIAHVQERLPR